MELTGKQRGQIKNTILRKFPPDVVLNLVRLLVWDWEIAKRECFPFRHSVPIPPIDALIQYRETLASAVSTGLSYTGDFRGAENTYRHRYIEGKEKVFEDDPLGPGG